MIFSFNNGYPRQLALTCFVFKHVCVLFRVCFIQRSFILIQIDIHNTYLQSNILGGSVWQITLPMSLSPIYLVSLFKSDVDRKVDVKGLQVEPQRQINLIQNAFIERTWSNTAKLKTVFPVSCQHFKDVSAVIAQGRPLRCACKNC